MSACFIHFQGSLSPLSLEEQSELVLVELVLSVDDLHGEVTVADLRLTHAENTRLLLTLFQNKRETKNGRHHPDSARQKPSASRPKKQDETKGKEDKNKTKKNRLRQDRERPQTTQQKKATRKKRLDETRRGAKGGEAK